MGAVPYDFHGQVVAITGASSGIGRATAHEFAKRGASVVLMGRSEGALKESASECEHHGAKALTISADVTNESAMQRAVEKAIDVFGGIDIWINNAGVLLLAKFEESPSADWRRVIETNLFGCVNGARAVLPHFRRRNAGVLINVSSQAAFASLPYASAYTTSKYAVRAFTSCLRQELVGSNIRASCVLPAAIDTPIFQNGANYTGRAASSFGTPLPVKDCARAIVRAAANPKREILVGKAGYAFALLRAVAPSLYETLERQRVERVHFQDAPAERSTGNLYGSMVDSTSGGWLKPGAGSGAKIAVGVAAAGLLAGAAWYWKKKEAEIHG